MTFRDYMIQKLEALNPAPKKKETKSSIIFYIPRKYSAGFFELKIPKPGSKNFKKEMSYAMEHFAIHFTNWGNSIALSLAKHFLDYEEQEAQTKEETK
ncbi:MAG: hypothetical protein IJK97_00725 [Thermoguttaceae bacterium]|nr:hypothetical protein [Thermoguttaceae bacterium]MBR0190432.1 hypothetical protein [Thermoguttaceae bacterium]